MDKSKKPNQLVIIGGGSSIQEGVNKGLWEKIKSHFTIGVNYSFHFLPSTVQIWLDHKFYLENKIKLDALPLMITRKHKDLPPNTIVLMPNSKYTRDIKKGCYKGSLSGIFALSVGVHLLDEGEIFLLGYDYGNVKQHVKTGKAHTHFYQGKIAHRGVGKINYYHTINRAKKDFTPFKEEKKVKIYNVSSISQIPGDIFERISYDEFFKKLNDKKECQPCLHKWIKETLK